MQTRVGRRRLKHCRCWRQMFQFVTSAFTAGEFVLLLWHRVPRAAPGSMAIRRGPLENIITALLLSWEAAEREGAGIIIASIVSGWHTTKI